MPIVGGIGGANPSAGVYELVQQYMSLEQTNMNRLTATKSEEQSRSSALTELNTKLRTLRTALDDFRWTGSTMPINAFSANTSDESIVGISANGQATEGGHTITVSSLARAHSIVSNEFEGGETASLAGQHTFEIEQGGETFEVSVTIEEDDTYREALARIATALNSSGAEISASVAATDSRTESVRLLLTSRETGTSSMISAVKDVSGNLAATIGLAGSSTAEQYADNTVQTAADALFNVDGLDFVSASNRVTGALNGVTLTLTNVGDTPVSLTIERDLDTIKESLADLIETYNTTVSYVRQQTQAADEEGENRGLFTGNTLFTSLRTQLRLEVMGDVSDPTGQAELVRLGELGITSDRYGLLSLSDEDALEDALLNHASDVERLFTDSEDGIAVRLVELLDRYVNAGGMIASQREIQQLRLRSIDDRIAREESYLERREEQLTTELAQLQSMLESLNQQQQYMAAIGLS